MSSAKKCDRCGRYYDENREYQKNVNGYKGFYDGMSMTTTSDFNVDAVDLCDKCITALRLFLNGAKVVAE